MSRTEVMTLRFCALMLATIGVELSLLVIVDPPEAVATPFLLIHLVAIVGFVISFIAEDGRQQARARAAERVTNDSLD